MKRNRNRRILENAGQKCWQTTVQPGCVGKYGRDNWTEVVGRIEYKHVKCQRFDVQMELPDSLIDGT